MYLNRLSVNLEEVICCACILEPRLQDMVSCMPRLTFSISNSRLELQFHQHK